MVYIPEEQLWMVIVGFIIAFVLSFGIGGNDVANSFGTSYGAKVLTLRQVCILASIFETLGAVLLGAKVSDTIRKGIIDIEPYRNDTDMLMMGNVAALSGSCLWLLMATMLRLPVSATHSIVGATVGFALVAHGFLGINYKKMGMIIASWFISPLMAGGVSTGLFLLCKHFILNKADPLESGLRWLPIFYAVTVVINLFSVFYDGPDMLGFHLIPLWGTFLLAFGSGLICALVVRFVIVPWQRNRIKAACLQQALAEEEEGQMMGSNSPTKHASQDDISMDEIAMEKANIIATEATAEAATALENTDQKEPANNDTEIPPIKKRVRCQSECVKKTTERDWKPSGERERRHSERERRISEKESGKERHNSESDKSHKIHKNATSCTPHFHLHTPMPASGRVLTEITHPKVEKPKPVAAPVVKVVPAAKPAAADSAAAAAAKPAVTVNGKPKIQKDEDAPLMDNEYKLGSHTPRRINTEDDLKHKVVNGGGDCKQLTNGVNDEKDVEAKLDEIDDHSGRQKIKDSPETVKLFSFLQILTAIFGGFAHGGNDVSNAIGPLVSLWLIGTTGQVSAKAPTPMWILLYGGLGISLGLALWGRRVMKTMGEDLTKITPSSGFCIEIGTAMTVLIASNIGIPISTTHCKVGSIVFVGRVRSRDNVDWSIFRNIMLAWLVTLPVSCGISAAIMAIMLKFHG